ncbi:hypothetical protein [Streptobacillus notomytis]|uniref:hypothetical protein n=1 Tax=Streptobacillus notomytis TaxID=1712031 RepID=UPI0009360356|nr:hypothetical protein [Streptobacillus notomytis]
MEEKIEFKYSSTKIVKELNMSAKKFLSLVQLGLYDFVKIEILKNGKKKYHYDILKVMKYINDYKEEKLRNEKLNEVKNKRFL